ncbi:tobH protein [Hoyosella rhizosphaerae]|uniref:TobH protein n=1 Tax=Hoyosella rhizosphaerae TaxID=1755582 RepID=A0A916UAH1_9ACTN|nr:tobH protein [Hoyosella rhizosphaerae]MBN4926004.1 tobH protein [Hoyosella rhizosphaerae]GGC66299.1 hypothetical protein GCM10011410_18600 [Hoyosella rhizosphaerae]
MNTLAPSIDFDDAAALISADQSGYLRHAATSGAQVRSVAESVAEGALRPLSALRPRSLIVLARRGVAIAAMRLVVDNVAHRVGFPVVVTHQLPPWSGALDVVLVVGDDPGDPVLVESVDKAVRWGCEVVIATPLEGPMRAVAASRTLSMPPRVAVPESFATAGYAAVLIAVMQQIDEHALGFDLRALAEMLDHEALRSHPQRELFENPAKALAGRMFGHRVIFSNGSAESRAVASHGSATMLRVGHIITADADLRDVVGAYSGLSVASLAADVDPIFHDPEIDGGTVDAPLRVVVLTDSHHRPDVERQSALMGSVAEVTSVEPLSPPVFPSSESGAPQEGGPPASELSHLGEFIVLCARLDLAAVYTQLVRSH